MNQVFMCGRLTADPVIRYTQSQQPMAIANYSIAVDRIKKVEGQPTADFFNCSAFGKSAEFMEKYCKKGTKLIVQGRLQNGEYTDRDGIKRYTTTIMVEHQEFAESKASQAPAEPTAPEDGFTNIPEGIDEDLPFAQPTR